MEVLHFLNHEGANGHTQQRRGRQVPTEGADQRPQSRRVNRPESEVKKGHQLRGEVMPEGQTMSSLQEEGRKGRAVIRVDCEDENGNKQIGMTNIRSAYILLSKSFKRNSEE